MPQIQLWRRLSPRGESGLKLKKSVHIAIRKWSLPTRGEWIEIDYLLRGSKMLTSLPTRGEWIEISLKVKLSIEPACLSPRGESGLKSKTCQFVNSFKSSLPTRGEWIEISVPCYTTVLFICLSPRGESGLKWDNMRYCFVLLCLSPRGESGLKLLAKVKSKGLA